jgi:branched-chain amino acid transport system permease protein
VALVIFTIFIVGRLKNSRLGRAWEAMREDDIACEAMGVDLTKTKVTAFALGAFWAGLAGVVFAAKTTFINPASFTLWESIVVLSLVVLGGMGSITGVVLGAFLLILLPEYLRAFSEYRMLIFGLALVIMMIFRPGGMITARRHIFTFPKGGEEE